MVSINGAVVVGGFGTLAGEEVSEQDGGADGSQDGVGGGESSRAPELAASSVEGGHVDDGNVAERVDDGVAAAAALAGLTEEFEHDGGEQARSRRRW